MVDVQVTLRGMDLSAEHVAQFLELAKRHGFTVMQLIDLANEIPDLGAYFLSIPRDDIWLISECLARFQGQSLFNLGQMTAWEFLVKRRVHKPYLGSRACCCLALETITLQLMIERGLNFADTSPAQRFVTPIKAAKLSTRAFNVLKREGIGWLEQAAYLARGDFRDIRNAGTGVINDIEARLGMRLPAEW